MILDIKLDGEGPVRATLNGLQLQPGDTEAVRKDIGEEALVIIGERFGHGQAPDGTSWPMSRRAATQGGQTLVEHGDLRDSFHYDATQPDGELAIFSDDKRAAVHNDGKTIRPTHGQYLIFAGADGKLVFVTEVHMPKRTILNERDEELAVMAEGKYLDFVEARWNGGGR